MVLPTHASHLIRAPNVDSALYMKLQYCFSMARKVLDCIEALQRLSNVLGRTAKLPDVLLITYFEV